MAKKNYGKDYEKRFARNFEDTFPKSFIYRLKDDVSHRKGSGKNPCDFICHVNGTLYMLEVKCHYGNTFPFSALGQYDTLITYLGLENTEIGVMIWFIDHDKELYVPIETITKMKENGEKSVNIRKLKDYKVVHIQSTKMRVFLKSDYSFMKEKIDK